MIYDRVWEYLYSLFLFLRIMPVIQIRFEGVDHPLISYMSTLDILGGRSLFSAQYPGLNQSKDHEALAGSASEQFNSDIV